MLSVDYNWVVGWIVSLASIWYVYSLPPCSRDGLKLRARSAQSDLVLIQGTFVVEKGCGIVLESVLLILACDL